MRKATLPSLLLTPMFSLLTTVSAIMLENNGGDIRDQSGIELFC